MSIVEGRVVFRNRMGKSTFMKVERTDGSMPTVWFHRDTLGETAYELVKAVDLFQNIRVQVGEEIQGRVGPLLPVERIEALLGA